LTTRSIDKFISRLKKFSQIAGTIVTLVGAMVLLGWMFDITTLKSVFPGLVSMKPNTSLGFIFSGLSLLFLNFKKSNPITQRIAQASAVIVGLIGLLTFYQYISGQGLGIDQLLFKEPPGTVGTYAPGRMAATTALNFLLIGLALLFLFNPKGYKTAQSLTVIAGLIGLLNLMGYLYGVKTLYGVATHTQMALHTALAFVIIGFGILCSRPEAGFMRLVISDTVGAIMLRRLLPIAILAPFLFGWLRIIGQKENLYGMEFGTALVAIANITIFVTLIWYNAKKLHAADLERKKIEEENRNFFTLSLDMLCIAGFDGYFKKLNPSWEKTLGFTVKELCAKPFVDFVHRDDRERTIAEAGKLATGRETISFENRYLCKDGSYKWILWNSVPSMEGRLIYANARDITERKRVEEEIKKLNEDLRKQASQLEAANKELEAFSYSVSHDLRAPLRSIDGFSLALLEDYGDKLDQEGKGNLGRVRAGCKRMSQLIDDMLNLSRLTRAEMRPEKVNLTALAQEIISELKNAEPGRKVEVSISDNLFAHCDLRLISAVLENLLNNAWKYTSKHTKAKIEIGSLNQNGKPVFYVKDDGAGFDMRYADKLFGAFQRLHRMDEFEGNGVGLATVKRVIHRHGGKVWAEAEPEKGATFYFTL